MIINRILRYLFLIIIVFNSLHIFSQENIDRDSTLLISVRNIGCIDIDQVNIKLKDSTYSFKYIKVGDSSAAQLMPYIWTNNEIAVYIDPPKPLFYSNRIGLQTAFFKAPIDFIGESKLVKGNYTVNVKICKKKKKLSNRQRRWYLEREIKINPTNNH